MSTELFNSSTSNCSSMIMDPQERIKRFGIECVGPKGDGILFAAGQWKPGGEYVQKLIVRNVTTSVKKLKYKLPSTRYFSLAYPEVIILSPGMFKELDVVFRPVVYDPYDDFILFRMQHGEGSGEFRVPVRALISKLQVSSPFGVDLGFCATHQITSRVFQLENFGEVDAPFRWDVSYPFKLNPSEGVVPVGHKQDIEVSVYPEDGSVYVSEAICHVGEGVHAIIPEPHLVTKLSAIGKYAYIVLSEPEVAFGEVLSGTPSETVTKEILLRNQGVVPAEFECIRHDNDRDEVFHISPRTGVVPTQSEIAITVSYSALASGTYSLDQYTFRTPGDCRTVLTCSGTSMPPKVTLHKENLTGQDFPAGSPADSINFRDTVVGGLETRLFFLKNHSNVKTTFSIMTDEEATFKVSPRQGVIPALLEVPVKISFSPSKPINYYRRVFVLIGDALPLFVDMMGTGFIRAKGEIKEQRPAPIRHAHIQAYRNRCTAGLGDMNPDEMDAMLENEGMSDLFAQVGTDGTRAVSVAMLRNPLTRTGEASRVDVAAAHELFIDDTEPYCRGVTVDTTDLDFGFTPYQSSSQPRTVVLTNRTRGKVAVLWFPPRVHGDYGNDATSSVMGLDLNSPVFSIEPSSSEIPPGGSQKYKIVFHPLQSNRNFISELEVVAFFKNQRTFRLVNDPTLTPPWCLTIRATGHTFSSGQLLAKVGLRSGGVRQGKLVFPACYLGDSVYQTVKLTNSSNLPSIFRVELGFDEDRALGNDIDGVFSVKPSAGEIAAEDFALVCIKFTPKTRKKVMQLVKCIVNGALGGQLLLEGTGALPQLCCPDLTQGTPQKIGTLLPSRPYNQKSFCMNPTSVGLSSSREFVMKNCSRLPLRFFCNLPPTVRGVLNVSPSSGFLRGNAETTVTISYAPQNPVKTTCKMGVDVYPIGGTPSKVIDARQPGTVAKVEPLQKFKVMLVAQGGVGAVAFDPPKVETDVKLVNTLETQHITLENVCDSVLQYELHYRMGFTPEAGSTSTEFISYPMQAMRKSSASTDGTAENHQNLFCEQPEGLLPARSRTSILFTFQPNRAGLFEFVVCCRLKSVDSSGNPLTISNEESALLHHAQMKMEQNISSNAPSDIPDMPLTMSLSGRASFPTLMIEDLRTDVDMLVSDVRQLWSQFSVPAINHEMNLPLTDEEVHFNTISSPDLSSLKRFEFQFTPDVIGSPRQVIYLQIRNRGFLTTSFKMNLPNEKELDLEQWCDEDELTEERLTQISILEELKCFDIEPREGVLAPGEGMVITMSYSHTSLKYGGYHKLPVHLKLSQGKQFWIDFIGITLANDVVATPSVSSRASTGGGERPPSLMLFSTTGTSKVHNFSSVPIGIPPGELPLQRMELINVSRLDVKYEIDQSTLRQLTKDNFDQEIIKVLNPTGTIAGRSSTYIEWIFNPIAAVTYSVDLSIKYFPSSMDTPMQSRRKSMREGANLLNSLKFMQLVLKAAGYDPRFERPPAPGSLLIGALPPSKRLVDVETISSLSEDMLDFKVIPKSLSASRLVVLRNHTSSDVEFSIEEGSSYLYEIGSLAVTPERGTIPPLGLVVLNVTITANMQPIIFLDRLKIIVQTVLRAQAKRGGGSRHDKIKDRLRSRSKVGSSQRTEIVCSPTAARSSYMENMGFRDASRTSSYPTSMSKSVGAGAMKGTRTPGADSATGLNDSSFSSGMLDSFASRSMGGSPGSFSRGGSSFFGSSEATKGALRGPSEVLNLRIEGEVYSREVISAVFDKGPQRGILDGYVAPVKMPFVPPRESSPASALRISVPGSLPGSSNSEMRSTKSPGSRPVPISERQSEVRCAVDGVLTSIFKDVLNAVDTREQLTRVVTQPVSGYTPGSSGIEPVGGPVYGVYFKEIVQETPLSTKLVIELKESGCTVSGEELSKLEVTKVDLVETMVQKFGITRKSQSFKEIQSIMQSTRTSSIPIRDFILSLSDPVAALLEKKLDILASERSSGLKRTRRSSSEPLRKGRGGIPPPESVAGEEGTNATLPKKPSLGLRQQTCLMLDNSSVEEIEGLNFAAQKIQNVARGARDRALVAKKKEDALNARAATALIQEEFVTLSADILRNTMFNLMQEAIHEEFQVNADPIKFVVKK